jgi:hypothetical protein
MRFLPTRIHGILDYLWSVLLASLPWLAGFDLRDRESWVCWVFAAGAAVYSLLTDYEVGVVPVLSMPVHLGLDAAGGLLLAASPWALGFAGRVWAPHFAFGLFSVFAGLVTRLQARRHALAHSQ